MPLDLRSIQVVSKYSPFLEYSSIVMLFWYITDMIFIICIFLLILKVFLSAPSFLGRTKFSCLDSENVLKPGSGSRRIKELSTMRSGLFEDPWTLVQVPVVQGFKARPRGNVCIVLPFNGASLGLVWEVSL